jgi:hypothetical protein
MEGPNPALHNFQQKLLPNTLCSLKFASCEKQMKRLKKKKEACDT